MNNLPFLTFSAKNYKLQIDSINKVVNLEKKRKLPITWG